MKICVVGTNKPALLAAASASQGGDNFVRLTYLVEDQSPAELLVESELSDGGLREQCRELAFTGDLERNWTSQEMMGLRSNQTSGSARVMSVPFAWNALMLDRPNMGVRNNPYPDLPPAGKLLMLAKEFDIVLNATPAWQTCLEPDNHDFSLLRTKQALGATGEDRSPTVDAGNGFGFYYRWSAFGLDVREYPGDLRTPFRTNGVARPTYPIKGNPLLAPDPYGCDCLTGTGIYNIGKYADRRQRDDKSISGNVQKIIRQRREADQLQLF